MPSSSPSKEEEEDPFDDGSRPPQAAKGVEVADFEASEATLRWRPPEDDGGLAITGYFVEFRKVGGGAQQQQDGEEWEEYPEKVKPAKRPTAKVTGLDTGAKYEFRVVCVNRAGRSCPSDPSPPQVIKAQRAPPRISRRNLGQEEGFVKCRKNQQLVLDVAVEGAPTPKTRWTSGEEEVRSDESKQLRVSHSPNVAKLVFARADRSVAGKYVLVAENQHGRDEVSVEVRVVGRPGKPAGPLVAADVARKSCTLRWGPPEDDGGSPVAAYEVEKFDPYVEQWVPVGSTKETTMQVKNLGAGKTYKFLVRATNREGDSQDLVMEEPIVAKDPFSPPGQPGRPEVCDWGPNYAELRWNTPEDDGGAEISSYRVEMRSGERRGGWQSAGTAEESDTTIGEQYIEEGGEYQFRVLAVNAAGESDASRASEPMVARPRFTKPKISQIPPSISVHCSQPLRISAEVSGEPRPQTSWWSPTGAKLESSETVTIDESGDGNVHLVMKGLTLADSGVYKFKAKSSEGSVEAEVKLTVLGPPGRPQGPLEVSDVRETGCRLSWKRPETDGGAQIKSYVAERRRVEQEEWVSCGHVQGKAAAVMKELECFVSDLLEGEVYMFRVVAIGAHGESEPLENFVPTCAASSRPVPDPPSQPRIRECEKNWVVLEWEESSIGPDVSHYVVEKWEQFKVPKMDDEVVEEEAKDKEEEEGRGEKPATPRPALGGPSGFSGVFEEYCSKWMTALTTEDKDNVVKLGDLSEGHTYMFRVRACNASGHSDPSEPSEEIICRGKQRPVIDRASATKTLSVSEGENATLQFRFRGDPVPERNWYFAKTDVRETFPTAVVQDKSHSSTLTLLNTTREKHQGRFEFRVSNEYGQETALVDLTVRVRPEKPRGPLRIEEVSAEGCVCSWKEPDHDGGSPVKHYAVEKATKSSAGWQLCGRTGDTSYRVTGLTADKEHRLRVRAVNAEGESDPLICVDGFVPENSFGVPTAPGRPEMVDGDSDHFVLAWDPPRNDGGSRVTGYQLEARKWRDSVFFSAGEVRMQLQKGEATGMEEGQSYAVRVRATNAAGPGAWSMESEKLVARPRAMAPKVKLEGPTRLTVRAGEPLSLHATVEARPAPEEVAFYRKEDGRGEETELRGDGENVRVEIKKGEDVTSAKLLIANVERKLSGSCVCKASNRHGTGRGAVEVLVQSPPSTPKAPLEAKEIHLTGCQLQWGASADDGGCAAEYLVERRRAAVQEEWEKQGRTTATQMSVTGLEAGAEVEFRVKAVNDVGESDALQIPRRIELKDQISPPLPPGPPDITDWSESRMELQWTEPLDCGGAPVASYHVEARLGGGSGGGGGGGTEWQLWEVVPGSETAVTLQMLNTGTEYQFRVVAINKAGRSESSHPSPAKVAKAKNLAPSLDTRFLRSSVRASAGERVKAEVLFQGEPPPDIQWIREGPDGAVAQVAANRADEVTVTVTERSARLALNSVRKAQEGRYTVTATNESGAATASFELSVRDRPSPPGRVTAATATVAAGGGAGGGEMKDGALLSWKRPEQDGGCSIDYYQVERLDCDKDGWMACGRCKAGESEFRALGLLPGRRYRFRVSAVNRMGESDPAEAEETLSVTTAAAAGEEEEESKKDSLVRAT